MQRRCSTALRRAPAGKATPLKNQRCTTTPRCPRALILPEFTSTCTLHKGAIVLIRARLGAENVESGMQSKKKQPPSPRTGSVEVDPGTSLLFLEKGLYYNLNVSLRINVFSDVLDFTRTELGVQEDCSVSNTPDSRCTCISTSTHFRK